MKQFDKHECETLALYKEFLKWTGLGMAVQEFVGVDYDDLLDAEKIFNIKITVYSLQPHKSTYIVWQSGCRPKNKMRLNLNVFDNHYSPIARMDLYTSTFICESCDASLPATLT